MKPLYQTIFQDLWEEISQNGYSEGDRLASENNLCARYNTSRQTVRNGVDLLVARGVVERQPGKGAFIKRKNRAPSETKVQSIVVVDGWYEPLEGHTRSYRQILRGVSSAFPQRMRVSLQPVPPPTKDSGGFWEAMGHELSGAIVVSPKLEIQKHLAKAPVPLVVVGTLAPNWADSLPSVRVNTFKMGYDTGRLLVQHGHKRFGFCSYELDNEGVNRYFAGVDSALIDVGLSWDPSFRVPARDDWGECRKAVDRFLEQGVTCIIMFESDNPSTVHHYLVSKGKRIPEDISLLVLELEAVSAGRPPYYSGFLVSQYDLGVKAGQLLQRRLSAEPLSMQNPREVIDLKFQAGKTLR